MIHHIAEDDRRTMTRILHTAGTGRLVEADDILIRQPGTDFYQPTDQKVAAHAIELAWIEPILEDDDHGFRLFRRTPDGDTAYDLLHAWCQDNPIRR